MTDYPFTTLREVERELERLNDSYELNVCQEDHEDLEHYVDQLVAAVEERINELKELKDYINGMPLDDACLSSQPESTSP